MNRKAVKFSKSEYAPLEILIPFGLSFFLSFFLPIRLNLRGHQTGFGIQVQRGGVRGLVEQKR